jgi:hypothetical protein
MKTLLVALATLISGVVTTPMHAQARKPQVAPLDSQRAIAFVSVAVISMDVDEA